MGVPKVMHPDAGRSRLGHEPFEGIGEARGRMGEPSLWQMT